MRNKMKGKAQSIFFVHAIETILENKKTHYHVRGFTPGFHCLNADC